MKDGIDLKPDALCHKGPPDRFAKDARLPGQMYVPKQEMISVAYLPDTKEIIASGGGVRNKTIMRDLQEILKPHNIELVTSDKYGIPPQYKEAIKFAEKLLSDRFFLTYGDGLSDVNLDHLELFASQQDTIATVTAVRPPARGRSGCRRLEVHLRAELEQPAAEQYGWLQPIGVEGRLVGL